MKIYIFIVGIVFFTVSMFGMEPVRIMLLGDSITYDNTYADVNHPRPTGLRHAYRNYLWYKLENAEYNVDFVGSRVAGIDIIPPFDPENEGYPGASSYDISNIIYSKLASSKPDIVLLHIGSNDMWTINNSDGNDMSGVNAILSEIDRFERTYHHHVKVILALIIDRTYHPDFTVHFNTNLRNLANSRIAHGDDIYLVNMYSGAGLNYSHDFQDPTHPNNVGFGKMATVWFNALRHFLPPPLPHAPTNIVTSLLESHEATLSWQDMSNKESGFKIYRGSALIATLGPNTTHYVLNDLEARTTYTYSIVAYNNNGSSQSQQITFTTKDDFAWLIPTVYNMMLN